MGDPLLDVVRGLHDRGLTPPTPVTRVGTYQKIADELAKISRLHLELRHPGQIRIPSSNELRSELRRSIDIPLRQAGVQDVFRREAQRLIDQISPNYFDGAEQIIRENRPLVETMFWYFNWQAYGDKLVSRIIDGFIAESERLLQTRSHTLRGELGGFLFNAHFTVAGLSLIPTILPTPIPNPLNLVFITGGVYKATTDALDSLLELVRYYYRPEELMLDLFRAIGPLLSLAFAEERDGLKKATAIGKGIASGFVGDLENAFFPDPLRRSDTYLVLGPLGYSILQSASDSVRFSYTVVSTLGQSGLLLIPFRENVKPLISLLMVPWALGTFIGPLLIDITLALLAFILPESLAVTFLRAFPWTRRVMNILDDVIDIGRFRRAVNSKIEASRSTGHRVDPQSVVQNQRAVNGVARGLETAEATRPERSGHPKSSSRRQGQQNTERRQQQGTGRRRPSVPPGGHFLFENEAQAQRLGQILGVPFSSASRDQTAAEILRRLLHHWNRAKNSGQTNVDDDIRRALRISDKSERRLVVRNIFNKWRNRWNTQLKNDHDLRSKLESAGIQLTNRGAPYIRYVDSNGRTHNLTLNVDHIDRLVDNPLQATNPNNLRLLTPRENSVLLEQIRRHDRFQRAHPEHRIAIERLLEDVSEDELQERLDRSF